MTITNFVLNILHVKDCVENKLAGLIGLPLGMALKWDSSSFARQKRGEDG